ncbi:hypothetical protein ACJIZ3_000279 [Penstemon smallii]|uniref:Protein TIC 214 n=1 Tax=Penstemon smallii TaxID=265156 RepID=A0ABD3RAD6_9LAMI
MRNFSIQCFCWLVNWSHFIHEMYIRSNKYLVSELRNSMARIFSRIPSPILTKKLKETSKTEERGTKQEQEGSTEEDPSPSFFLEERADPNKIDETEEIRVNGKEDEFHFRVTETGYKIAPFLKSLI